MSEPQHQILEDQEYQQVDYEESGEEQPDEYQNHDFLNSEHPAHSNSSGGNEAHHGTGGNGRRVLPPDENGDIIVPNVLFVSRFKLGVINEADVKRFFDRYGPITHVVIRYKVAFVEFEHDEDAKRAKHDAHFKPGLGSDSLIVDFRKDNKVKPRPDDRPHHRDLELPKPRPVPHSQSDDRFAPPLDRNRGPPPAERRFDDRYPPNDAYPPSRHDYYPDDRYNRPPIDRPDSRGNPPPNYRDNRGPPADYQPAKYGPPPGYPEDRKAPPVYQNPPPGYRENRPPPGYGSVPPPDFGRSGAPPNVYDERRAPAPYSAPKRPYDSVNDYPPYNAPPIQSRGGSGPPLNRDYPPSRPYSDRPPVDIPPPNRGGGVELSTYAAGASRHRDWVDDGNYKSRPPPDAIRPAGNPGYPPVRYDEPPRPIMRGDYPPPVSSRDGNYELNRNDYRGVDNYQTKRPRY